MKELEVGECIKIDNLIHQIVKELDVDSWGNSEEVYKLKEIKR